MYYAQLIYFAHLINHVLYHVINIQYSIASAEVLLIA